MIFTARYSNKNLKIVDPAKCQVVGITLSPPRFPTGYKLVANPRKFGPPKSMWGQTREAFALEYTAYLNEYADVFVPAMKTIVDASTCLVLCCYEDLRDETKHCHRTVLAAWMKEKMGLDVMELAEDRNAAAEQGFPISVEPGQLPML